MTDNSKQITNPIENTLLGPRIDTVQITNKIKSDDTPEKTEPNFESVIEKSWDLK